MDNTNTPNLVKQEFLNHCKSILSQPYSRHDNLILLLHTINWLPRDLNGIQNFCADVFDESLTINNLMYMFEDIWDKNWIREYDRVKINNKNNNIVA